jgi:hypothetical protein
MSLTKLPLMVVVLLMANLLMVMAVVYPSVLAE